MNDSTGRERRADVSGEPRADGTFTAGHHTDVNIFDLVAERDSLMKLPEGPARTAALERWQAPRNGVPLAAQRVFVGRDVRRAAVLRLSDPQGRPRVQLLVDSLGAPKLEFLDAAGNVTQRLPGGGD